MGYRPVEQVTAAVDVTQRAVAEVWTDVRAGQVGVVLDGEIVHGQGRPRVTQSTSRRRAITGS